MSGAPLDLGHAFADPRLLEIALTHPSFAHENGGPHYERLEFLGDAVLQLAVTAWLVERFPDASEGELTRTRQQLVREAALAEVATALGLGAALRLGVGEERTGGRERPSVLAGALEAVLGAVYGDAGYGVAEALVRRWLGEAVEALVRAGGWRNPKSLLQERAQATLGGTPVYEVLGVDGPAHAPTFAVAVRVGQRVLGQGSGPSKQKAEWSAANEALASLGGEGP